MSEESIKLLHIYGQESFHDAAMIVGNREALIELANAIDKALDGHGNGTSEAFVSDGEGYGVRVVLYDKPWDEWHKLPMPYTEDYAKERRPRKELLWPHEIWLYNEAMNRKRKEETWWQRLLSRTGLR